MDPRASDTLVRVTRVRLDERLANKCAADRKFGCLRFCSGLFDLVSDRVDVIDCETPKSA